VSRRKKAEKRSVVGDYRYNSPVVAKFINYIMYDGKKSVAESVVYTAFTIIDGKEGRSAIDLFYTALENVRPVLEVRSRRVGGATYQIPTEVRSERADALSMKWLIASSRKRPERSMAERLAREILEAFFGRGAGVKKKEDVHKMADANKSFAHYRW
jgi:small subunit ribosomal protein S7